MTRIEIATQVLVANPQVVDDAILKAERINKMTEPEKLESLQQIKEIKEAIAKYHASLRNIGVHRAHAANALIHDIQEILQIKWSDRLCN